MLRSTLIEELNKKFATLDRNDVEFAVKIILDTICDSLARGRRVEVRGFGSFTTSQRAAVQWKRPLSGLMFQLPAMRVTRFKPAKLLREKVAGIVGAPKVRGTQMEAEEVQIVRSELTYSINSLE